ncbi:GCN5-like N-acetyltransferase [Burkholderia multivorans]|uniref:GCN5-related N-acetyltransferase n=2 Tax=Burkholderia cepacia complex TaxID=87882 RepID=A4JD39_BURVG|nr:MULTISPECIES: GNAT family N-acetyltransferase [Burkholderia cepacia complex]ABO54192.1 GCN5-related N-acetyltransferase [Burkholderia vietnamiensis G4]MCB4347324.1 GNAT family N-acetyltransferase [Burkholderia vietnamiensis]SAJ96508.1 GCN5-like N-acetyltransferase [Burkholderia multivorans]
MITFSIEQFSDVYNELLPLLAEHYNEISTHVDHGVPLDPLVEVYRARQADGSLMMVIGREEGKIVSYLVCFIAPGLHYRSCLTCSPDIFYVEPSRRGASIGVRMFRFVEKELKRRGVQRWAVGSKVKHDASPLFRFLDFEPVETTYEKWL